MQIPLIIVDDEEVDRMVVIKRLDRSDKGKIFKPVYETDSGDEFLEKYLISAPGRKVMQGRPLVLMDVNMPGRNGFETIEEMERLLSEDDIAEGAVIMMFTSSQNQRDIDKANALGLVKGYIVKPFDDDAIERIEKFYADELSDD